MSGLSLRTGISVGGSYTPMTPASALPSTATPSTIAQKAYGVNGDGSSDQRKTAAYGSVSIGVIAVAALVYLWWSLPR